MTKLYLTRIDYKKDLSTNSLALGLWCLPHKELYDLSNVQNRVLEYTVGSKDIIRLSNQETKHAYEHLLPYLVDGLNTLHGQSLGVNFWNILVGYWFKQYLGVLYNRYQILIDAHDKIGKAQVSLIPRNREYVASDTDEYSSELFSDRLNHQLFGQIIRARKLFQVKDVTELAENNGERVGRRLRNENLKRLVFFVSCICGKFNKVVFLRTYFSRKLLFRLSLKFLSIPILGTPKLKFTPKRIERRQRNILGARVPIDASDFEHLAMELLPANIPSIFVEGFPKLLRLANYLRPKKARVLMTANAFASQEIYKVWAGKILDEDSGTHAILQHGANYGQSEIYSDEEFETGSCSAFFTSGWQSKIKDNVFSLVASTRLGGIGSYQNNTPISNPKGDVIWVLASLPRYQYTQWSAPQGPEFLTFINEQGMFVKSLSRKVREKIICRPYMYDYGWGDLKLIERIGGTFRCDNQRKPLRKLIKKSSLTVFAYNSTSIMESMAMNVPTLCFWDSEFWEWRIEAKPILKHMMDVGIYHNSAESAAMFINQRFLLNDLDQWWKSPSVQSVRELYCKNYANTGDNEYEQWESQIKGWLEV